MDGNVVLIRLLTFEDIESYLQSFSLQVQEALRVSSLAEEQQYLKKQLLEQKKLTWFYGIFLQMHSMLIGAIEIRDHLVSRGQLYCWLHHDFWGKGLFVQSLQMVLQSYFMEQQTNLVSAHVDVSNTRSYYALKKTGFADMAMISGPYEKQYAMIFRNKDLA